MPPLGSQLVNAPAWIWWVCLGVLGLWVGSYLNLVIYRAPRHIQTISGPSFCTVCNHQLGWAELIPVFSYLWLHGRCKNCGERIPVRYLAVEIISAILYIAVYSIIGVHLILPAYLIFASMLLALSVIDIQTHLLPSQIIYWGGGTSLLLLLAALAIDRDVKDIIYCAIGFVLVGTYFFIIWFIFPKGIGLGDVRLSFVLGGMIAPLGLISVLFMLGIAFGGLALVGITYGITTHKNLHNLYVPLGPSLAIGAIMSMGLSSLIAQHLHFH